MADTKKNTTAAADIPADASTNTTEKKAPVKKAAAKKTTAKKESAASEKSAKKTAKTTKKTTKKTTAKTAAAAKKAETAEAKAVEQPAANDVKKTAAAGEAAEKAVPAVKEKAEVAVKEKGEVALKEKAEVAVVEEPKKETKAKAVKAKKETKAAAAKTKKETKVKTEEAKKAEPAKEVKAESKTEAVNEEPKAEPVKEAKAEVKTAPVKEEAKAQKKAEPVKEEVKAEPAKEDVKVLDEAKKAEKAKHYNSFELNTVEEMARAMGVKKNQDELRSILLSEADLDKVAADLIAEANLTKDAFDFEEDGYDIDLIPVYVKRVAEKMDFKASDYQQLADEINAQLDFVMTSDAQVNADEYHILFELVKKVLMLAQQKDIHSLADLEQIIPADLKALVVKFMDVAYDILKNWQYNDCKFYEGFIFAVLSQFDDIFAELNNRAMMDVSDLYIVHGDFGLGDANYEYILRENQLKDYIYFRFANIYRDIDRNKAKAIASGALRYVDGRFDYYPNIIEILES